MIEILILILIVADDVIIANVVHIADIVIIDINVNVNVNYCKGWFSPCVFLLTPEGICRVLFSTDADLSTLLIFVSTVGAFPTVGMLY